MEFSKYQSFSTTRGHVWPWGAAGDKLEVGKGGVERLESHPNGCIVVTAKRSDEAQSRRYALYEQGVGTVAAESAFECEVCHQTFSGPQALGTHRKTHVVGK